MRIPQALLLGLLLAACAPLPTAGTTPQPTSPPGAPALPTETGLLPSATPNMQPTAAPASTGTGCRAPAETETPTSTASPPAAETTAATAAARRYVFPVQPSSAAGFAEGGHPYPATDIFAPAGSRFVAVIDGVVDFVSYEDRWDPAAPDMAAAGGLCVAIIGEDGVRYYGSHLQAVAEGIRPGVRVEAGGLLGYVGSSGNAAGTSPHLHFGISRPTYPEDWQVRRGEVDPFPFLTAWRSGHAVTPPLPAP